jgi:hypothetical protein
MPYLVNFGPDYSHDIFVSYAHGPLITRWSQEFADDLAEEVNFSLKEKDPSRQVGLWIDRLEGHLGLTPQLQEVRKAALLLVIMSDFYLDSEWCKNEAAWFEEARGGWANTDGRIFVVKAGPTDLKRWPKFLRDERDETLPGYNFYKQDRPGESARPLLKTDAAYALAKSALADQIAMQLKLIAERMQARKPDVGWDRPSSRLSVQSSDMEPDIFISYAREDQERVADLAAVLEREGWSVFWDQDIPPGEDWDSHIGRALEGARCVIAVWSEHFCQESLGPERGGRRRAAPSACPGPLRLCPSAIGLSPHKCRRSLDVDAP